VKGEGFIHAATAEPLSCYSCWWVTSQLNSSTKLDAVFQLSLVSNYAMACSHCEYSLSSLLTAHQHS